MGVRSGAFQFLQELAQTVNCRLFLVDRLIEIEETKHRLEETKRVLTAQTKLRLEETRRILTVQPGRKKLLNLGPHSKVLATQRELPAIGLGRQQVTHLKPCSAVTHVYVCLPGMARPSVSANTNS
jgi:hypothetical protein